MLSTNHQPHGLFFNPFSSSKSTKISSNSGSNNNIISGEVSRFSSRLGVNNFFSRSYIVKAILADTCHRSDARYWYAVQVLPSTTASSANKEICYPYTIYRRLENFHELDQTLKPHFQKLPQLPRRLIPIMITKTAMEEKLPSLQRYIDAVLTMTAVLRVEVGGEEVVAGAEILVDGQIRQQVKRCLADFFAPWDTDIETHSILMSNNAIVSPTPPARRHFLNTRRMSEGARTLVPIMEQLESSHLENCSGSHEEINCESSEWSMIRETLITVPIHSCTNTTTTTTTTTAENADTVIAGLGIAGDRRSMAASLVMSIMSAHDDAADYQSCIDEEEKEEMEKAEEEGEDGGAPCATVFKRISVIEPPWFQNHPDAQSVLNTSTSVIQRIRALPDHNLPHNNNSNKLTASYSSLSASTAALATPSLSMKSVEETLETQQNHHRSLSHDTIASFYEDAVTDHGNIEHLAEEGEDEEVEEDCSSDKQRPPSLSAVIAQQPPLTFFTSLATSSPPLTRAKAYATLGDEIIELPPRRQAIQDNSNDALPAILSLSSSAAINTTSNDEIQVLNSQQQQQQQIPSALPSSTSKFGSLERMKKILTSKSRKEEDEATLSGSPHPPPVYTLTRDIILKGKNSIKKGIALISTSSTRLRQQEGPDDNPGGVRVSEDEANVVPWNRVSTLFRRQKSVESKQEVEDQTSTGQASDSGVLNIHRQISLDAINKANSSISKRNSSNSKYHIGVSIDDLEFKLVCDKKRHRASRRLSKVPGIGSPPVLSDSSYQEPPSFKRNHLHNHRDSVISVALTSCSTVDDDKEVLMGRGDEEKSLRRRSNLFRSHTLSQMSGTEVMKHYITIKYVFVGGRSENISAVLVRVSRNISLNGFKTKIIDKLLRMQQQQQQQLEEVQSRQHQQHYDQSYFLGRMNRMEYIDEDGHSVTLLDEEDFAISINECSKKLILYEAQIG